MDVAPIFRDFCWRALRNVLPSIERLRSRGVPLDVKCPFYDMDETVVHSLIHCVRITEVWRLENFLFMPNLSSQDCFMQVLQSNSKELVSLFTVIAWQIWNSHNDLIWKIVASSI